MVSCPHCDTDAGSGRLRAPPVSETFRAPHDEVPEHERDTGRRKLRALRRALADRETPASLTRGTTSFPGVGPEVVLICRLSGDVNQGREMKVLT
jgi:hypothetical protein